jgi:proline iminopeptidase
MPTTPTAEGALARAVLGVGCRLISFDPPGAFRSTRLAQVSMPEMLGCADETLRAFAASGPVSVIGHSMGGLCSIAYTLAHQDRVKRLVLIGTISGFPAIARGRGMPWGMRLTDPDLWRFSLWGLRLSTGRGNLSVHKKFLQLLWRLSYVDKGLIPELKIAPEDRRSPAPVRDRWPRVARQYDYLPHLKEIRIPTLVCVGRGDPQAPVACSEELARNIPGAQLVIFEHSGHYPFIEEQSLFARVLSEFLGT